MSSKLRTCRQCDWVHFGVTKADAMAEVRKFLTYWRRQPRTTQELFGDPDAGPPTSLAQYSRCRRCGASWRKFRPAKKGDCPEGCTINPIRVS